MRRLLLSIITVALLVAGAIWLLRGREEASSAPVVLAAASLQESLDAAANTWAAKGRPRPLLSFAASSALARQIEAGAPADLFISADEEWMDALQAKDLLKAGTRAPLAGNALVLIAPRDSAIAVDLRPGFPLERALGGGRLALADPSGVPAGRYARQALEKLGMWDAVAEKVAAGDNVRAALALVAQREAPLGVVYATEAAAEPKVRVVAVFPANTHLPITYPVALLKTARSKDAEAFRSFLLSPEGQAILRRFGFGPASR